MGRRRRRVVPAVTTVLRSATKSLPKGAGRVVEMAPRRSCLSVPGSSEKMLGKARGLPADEVVIDLEDSVAPAAKDSARAAVVAAIAAGDWGGRTVTVRVNATDSRHCFRDLIDLAGGAGPDLAGIVLPKAERAGDVEFVARLLAMAEAEAGRERPLTIQALIETAEGLARIREIAGADPRVEALIIGYADLAASLGRQPTADGRWHTVRETVLIAARAAGIAAIDGPHLDIADVDGCRRAADRARTLGYDGKWALHPAQLEVINEVFTPSQPEFDRACRVLDALDRSERDEARGAILLDGEMVDEASRKLALRIVARGRAAGLRVPAPSP